MKELLSEIRNCAVCADSLPHCPRPVLSVGEKSKIVVIGQAPGAKVHASGVPWADASGRTLRKWLGVDESAFYDIGRFALLPMGFCYPGKDRSGDLPPRKECAPLWHDRTQELMTNVELILLIGAYAQEYYLGADERRTLTERVKSYQRYLPRHFPLPHPSPRNGFWLRRNPWFEQGVLPELQKRVDGILTP